MHTLFAQYMLCPTQLDSSESSGVLIKFEFASSTCLIPHKQLPDVFLFWAKGPSIFLRRLSAKLAQRRGWMHNLITSSDETFSDDEIFAEISHDDPTEVRLVGERNGSTEAYDGPRIWPFIITYGVLLSHTEVQVCKFLELNCCSSHTVYFLKVGRLFGGGDATAKTRTPQLQYRRKIDLKL